MPNITIQGTIINFPDSAASPNWAQPVIDFAEAVQNALNGVVGPYDVAPQVLDISLYNPGSNINLTSIPFPTSAVRAVFMRYALFRGTDTTSAAEAGNLILIFNANSAPGSKWEVGRDAVGDASITFTVLDNGQIQFSTAAIAGSDHTGALTFAGQSLLQSNS